MSRACPICREVLTVGYQRPEVQLTPEGEIQPRGWVYRCDLCGRYRLPCEWQEAVNATTHLTEMEQALVRHFIFKNARSDFAPYVVIERVLAEEKLPPPMEQADRLLLLIEERSEGPGIGVDLKRRDLAAVGALNMTGLAYLIRGLQKEGLVDGSTSHDSASASLTFDGWRKCQQLRKGISESRKGFMAMAFSNAVLTEMFQAHLKPAAEAAGFRLMRADEDAPAGMITARIQNEITTSCFVVADVSDENNGAYWEAGFATGQGKRVIYMCDREKLRGVHFDVAQYNTIIWDVNKGAEAGDLLKQIIRATFPADAKFSD